MSGIFSELKRRNVFRVAVAYLVGAWVIAQVADLVLDNIGADPWVMQALLLVMAIGFVVSLLVSWAYEITPEGIKRERDVARDESITHQTGKRLNIITIGLVTTAVGLLGVDRFLLDNAPKTPQVAESADTDSTTVADAAVENSIAVLPFVNMSADADQEYFADGVSEEILNALVKNADMKVSGRTSSFAFKGKDVSIQDIGVALSVSHVLEGSVRKQGDQVRITAQLIKADDGFHLWSETYDRSLQNIFDVQDDIARRVTNELIELLDASAERRLVSTLTENVEAYDLYLRGRDHLHQRINDNIPKALGYLEQSVELDPQFAEAWAALAEAAVVAPGYITIDAAEAIRRAQLYADRAIALDDSMALPYAVKGMVEKDLGDLLGSHELLQKAFKMEPDNVLVLRWLGTFWSSLGHLDRAQELVTKAYLLDPMSRTEAYNMASTAFAMEDLDSAERFFALAEQLQNASVGEMRGDLLYAHGDSDGAIDYFMRMYDDYVAEFGNEDIGSRGNAERVALAMYLPSEHPAPALEDVLRFLDAEPGAFQSWQVYGLIKLGFYELVFDELNDEASGFSTFANDFMWLPMPRSRAFREHASFPMLLESKGFLKAWQALGWPDFCQPLPGTDGSNGQFRCQ
ncbi:MAG: hypothetical protein AAF351_04255 [Pseudomonadota bacterium]